MTGGNLNSIDIQCEHGGGHENGYYRVLICSCNSKMTGLTMSGEPDETLWREDQSTGTCASGVTIPRKGR
jgi:hypothetical protein